MPIRTNFESSFPLGASVGGIFQVVSFPATLGVLQNDAAPRSVDDPPFLDLLQGPKAAETGEIVVQAAISHARRLRGAVDFTH